MTVSELPVADFETLFQSHYVRLARVVYRVLGDTARAEEIAADVFVRYREKPPAEGNAAGWLHRTAMRLAFDALRRDKTSERLAPRLVVTGDARDDVEREAARQRVRATLAAIRPERSELLILRSEGYSYAEIASMTGTSAASIGTYISRAEEEFRKEYEQRYGELG